MTIADIIEKRKRIWRERGDIEYDKAFTAAAAQKILSEPSLREEVKQKPYLLIEVAFYIVDKKKKTVPFFLNEVQSDFITRLEDLGTNKPFFILKGRQQGFTSLITAIQVSYAIVMRNFSGFTIADSGGNTRAIFNDKGRMVYERLPEILKPTERFNSVNELYFDKLNSSWRIATATDNVGRSRTLNFVHFSEVAFYDCRLADLQKGIGEAMIENAFCVYETTANGFNEAKELWDSGSCHNLFYEWWRTVEYRSCDYEYLETNDGWLKKRIAVLKEKGLDKEQITWYAKKYASYLDKSTIRQEYPCTAEEAFVASGRSIFDVESLQNRLAVLCEQGRRGYFRYRKSCETIADGAGVIWRISDIEFIESKDGYIVLHEEPRVKKDKSGRVTAYAPYALGGDTAGSGEDYFTAKVIDCFSDKCVATMRIQRIDEDLYAEQIYCLGMYYHEALIGIETNYSRHPTRVLSQKYGYANLYMRERLDRIDERKDLVAGFETTPRTKPIIIGNLVELMREFPEAENDRETLKEMTTFVRKENGSTEAISGAHDDLVMAAAIGHFISKGVPKMWKNAEEEKDDFISRNFGYEETETPYMNWTEE